MIVFEANRTRTLFLRLERGENLHEALAQLADKEQIGGAWLRFVGAFSKVTLQCLDQEQRELGQPRHLGACEVLSLEGSIALRGGEAEATLMATVAVDSPAGMQVIGGRVKAATVFSLEGQVLVGSDLRLEKKHDRRTGLDLWAGHSRGIAEAPATDAPAPSGAVGWGDVAAASAAPEAFSDAASESAGVSWGDVAEASSKPDVLNPPLPRNTSEEDRMVGMRKKLRRTRAKATVPAFKPAPLPGRAPKEESAPLEIEAGDYIDHRQFGICRVDKVTDDDGVMLKLPNSRRKMIKLGVFEIHPPREDSRGRRIFKVRPRKK